MDNKITLLNEEEWDRMDLLSKMDSDSFYYGYLGINALSSSSCKLLLESPNDYKKSIEGVSQKENQALRDGRLFHMALLEEDKFNNLKFIQGTKARKEYKEAVSEYGYHNVFTESEYDNTMPMVSALKNNADANFLLSDCDYEIPGIGTIEGLPFRAKADAITKDGRTIIDLKTTSKKISNFKWVANDFKYNLQASLYTQIFDSSFVFIVINKSNYDIGIFETSYEFLGSGDQLIQESIAEYNKYFKGGVKQKLINNRVVRGVL